MAVTNNNATPNEHSMGGKRPRTGMPEKRRIALYSHDTMGIGHLRRNLLVAQALCRATPRTASLIIAGAREAGIFPMPSGIDCLTLPPVQKRDDGSYESRSLGISFDRLIEVRKRTIDAALNAFQPELLIVDKVPRGVACELDLALQSLKSRGKTRCVLGLRDVLDDPESVRREWDDVDAEETINTFYDAVWVYGDEAVYDTVREYNFSPELTAKTVYTGYLDPRGRRAPHEAGFSGSLMSPEPPHNPFVLCLIGGGQDGASLVDAVSQAELPSGMSAVILLGPFTSCTTRQQLHRRAQENARLHVMDFVTNPETFIARSDRIIAMGGYNTICEVLAFETPALIVPRIKPRMEQFIRAKRLHDLGLIDLLPPDQLSPQAVSDWLADSPPKFPCATCQVDMRGNERLPQLVEDLLDQRDWTSQRSQSTPEDLRFVER